MIVALERFGSGNLNNWKGYAPGTLGDADPRLLDQEVGEAEVAEDIVHCPLDELPHGTDGTVRVMTTTPSGAGVPTAKPCVENPTSQSGQKGTQVDLTGRSSQGIAARRATKSRDVALSLEDTEQFRDIRAGNPFRLRDLWNGQRDPLPGAGQGEKATEAIFFLR